ncbi:HPr kinase/phosphorylase [Agrobacterium sp. SORGH_AS 787]|uniref:HPr kinase/phosphorylase n=1 Tax=Agrobacterium sp. SORGH_AS 787 TaxID=3041775 RepID=UPI00278A3EB9|nr:serine kinase of HPr protein (carbohydrate metabolism regulator) [Rhizobium sp. SORGH_AS_0787]
MSADRINYHATAIVIDGTGLLFVGPSGSGKSELAFSFMTEAKRCGLDTALVADDQVLMSPKADRVIVQRPESIAGLFELRGSGIVEIESIPSAAMDYAVTPVLHPDTPRLPPETEWLDLPTGNRLPLIRIPLSSITPYGKFAALAQNLFKAQGK